MQNSCFLLFQKKHIFNHIYNQLKPILQMKTIFLALFLITGVVFSQENTLQTTTELEYNYLTSGYEDDIKKGRDIKTGYTLKPFYDVKSADWQFKYEGFIEEKDNVVKAVLITIVKLKNNKTKHLCLPFNNKNLLARFMKDYEALGISMGLHFDVTVFDLLQRLINVSQEKITKG